MNKTARLLFVTASIVIGVGVIGYINRIALLDLWEEWSVEASLPEPVMEVQIIKQTNTNQANVDEFILPEEINLDVPFTPQAPFAVWDEQHKESCEEAASLMVHYFWQRKTFTPEIAEQELQKMIDFQNEKYGDYKDTDAAETAQLIRDYLGYRDVRVQYDITLDDIKQEVAQGRPVIVPAAGRLLKNPYFRRPGPLYHMLVVRGYTKDKIITNDPGTKRGEQFVYDPDVLYDAIHDWNNGDIDNGRKAMVVVYPNP